MVFDKKTGRLTGVLDAAEITCRRTAAASALAADFLARADARRLTVIGTGALAEHFVAAYAGVRPLESVTLCGRNIEKAERLANRLAHTHHNLELRATDDAEAAVIDSDIVSTITSSREPDVCGDWVQPGTHVDLVGAYLPDSREADDVLMAKATIYADTRDAVLADAGDLLLPIAAGVITPQCVKGDLFDLCTGRVSGRESEQAITVFKSVGTALEDLVAANLAFALAPAEMRVPGLKFSASHLGQIRHTMA